MCERESVCVCVFNNLNHLSEFVKHSVAHYSPMVGIDPNCVQYIIALYT